jgi:predicted component of type VI protein secretion system
MNQLTLEWQEANQPKTLTISDQQPTKYPGTIRIGRDPVRCDIVLSHPTVSGLHVEIFFNPAFQQFYLRNLRPSNLPWINGSRLETPEAPLSQGSIFYLGEAKIAVTAVSIVESNVPPTVLIAPPIANSGNAAGHFPPVPNRNVTPIQPAATPANQVYGLECPHCHRTSPYERLDLGCPWCGTSLAAAASVLIAPKINLGGQHHES